MLLLISIYYIRNSFSWVRIPPWWGFDFICKTKYGSFGSRVVAASGYVDSTRVDEGKSKSEGGEEPAMWPELRPYRREYTYKVPLRDVGDVKSRGSRKLKKETQVRWSTKFFLLPKRVLGYSGVSRNTYGARGIYMRLGSTDSTKESSVVRRNISKKTHVRVSMIRGRAGQRKNTNESTDE